MVSLSVDGDCSAFNRVWFILVVLFNLVVYADFTGSWIVVWWWLLLLFLVFWWCDSLVGNRSIVN